MEENRARRVVDRLRARGIEARMEKAGVYQFGIHVKIAGGREAVWDTDGTAALEAQVVDAMARTDYDQPIATQRRTAPGPAAPLPIEGGGFRQRD